LQQQQQQQLQLQQQLGLFNPMPSHSSSAAPLLLGLPYDPSSSLMNFTSSTQGVNLPPLPPMTINVTLPSSPAAATPTPTTVSSEVSSVEEEDKMVNDFITNLEPDIADMFSLYGQQQQQQAEPQSSIHSPVLTK